MSISEIGVSGYSNQLNLTSSEQGCGFSPKNTIDKTDEKSRSIFVKSREWYSDRCVPFVKKSWKWLVAIGVAAAVVVTAGFVALGVLMAQMKEKYKPFDPTYGPAKEEDEEVLIPERAAFVEPEDARPTNLLDASAVKDRPSIQGRRLPTKTKKLRLTCFLD